MSETCAINCLVLGDPEDNIFTVKIQAAENISTLKGVIKIERGGLFKDVDITKITLNTAFKQYDEIKDLTELPGQTLHPLSNIRTTFEHLNPEEVHVIIGRPPPADTLPPEVVAELDSLREFKSRINESLFTFHLVIIPKTKTTTPWSVNVNTATLAMLSALVNPHLTGSPLGFDLETDGQGHVIKSDEALQNLLRVLVGRGLTKIKVTPVTLKKPYSQWRLQRVCKILDIPFDAKNPTVGFERFICMSEPVGEEVLTSTMAELNKRVIVTPFVGPFEEARKSAYVYSILCNLAYYSDPRLTILPECQIEGRYGRGPVDLLVTAQSGVILGVTEVKGYDFMGGIAQNAMQIDSAFVNRKRKADQGSEVSPPFSFGIVTDATTWFFLKCMLTSEDDTTLKTTIALSEPLEMRYDNSETREKVRTILGHISWLVKGAMESNHTKKLKIG